MNTLQKSLAGLLVAQAVLIPIAWRRQAAAPPEWGSLAEFDRSAVSRIEVAQSGDPGDAVTLERSGEGWVVASAGNYPAKTDSVDALLGHIADLKIAATPAATQAVSHEAMDVGPDDFGRRIALTIGAETKTYFLGRSDAGGLNVRREGSDEVFAGRGATLFDFSTGGGEYVERRLLDVDPTRIDSFSVTTPAATIAAQRADATWLISGLGADREADPEKIERLLDVLANLNISAPAEAPAAGFDTGATTITWTGTGEDSVAFAGTLRISPPDGDHRFVQIEGGPGVGRVFGSTVGAVVDATIDGLTRPVSAGSGEGALPAEIPPVVP